MNDMWCRLCNKQLKSAHAYLQHMRDKHSVEIPPPKKVRVARKVDVEPDYGGTCGVCNASPILPLTGLCGPCTFGEADTVNGNW